MQVDVLPSTVMPPSAVTLTFDLLTRNHNQYVSSPRYICDLILVKLTPIVTKILHTHGFLDHCLLWPWPLTSGPKNLTITSTSQMHLWPKLGKIPFVGFEMWCSQGSWDTETHTFTHALTHWRTDPITECLRRRFSTRHKKTTVITFLTSLIPAVPNCCCSEGLVPYWSNPPFLIFDIRALWRSGLSARAPECQKLKIVR